MLMRTNLLAGALLAAASWPSPGQSARLSPYRDSIPETLVSFEMIPVPGGSVTLDTPQGPRTVSLEPFWIGKTEVTWDEFDVWAFRLDRSAREATDSTDAISRPSRPYGAPDRGFGHHGYAAIAMTYHAAQLYCVWLSSKTGKHYRLPTDAEWTRAVQAGVGGTVAAAWRDSLAWHAGNSADKAHPVAARQPDALGLYDMLGNVAEWVTGADGRPLVRGGSWADPPQQVGPGARAVQTRAWNETDPQFPRSRWWLADAPFVGFRIVLLP
ncbi:MAG TPA: SUMF1/EgtB/PvdO family nonheme iron enzyme [Gemmatimonadales bacterium]|jgi:formylglycine-generating enzyme required for sulfatase activity